MYKLICGNSLEELKKLEENSIDSIITDPPYELGFMGKSWDKSGIAFNKELWKEALRVLKPGGHLVSFIGSTGKACMREGLILYCNRLITRIFRYK